MQGHYLNENKGKERGEEREGEIIISLPCFTCARSLSLFSSLRHLLSFGNCFRRRHLSGRWRGGGHDNSIHEKSSFGRDNNNLHSFGFLNSDCRSGVFLDSQSIGVFCGDLICCGSLNSGRSSVWCTRRAESGVERSQYSWISFFPPPSKSNFGLLSSRGRESSFPANAL